MENFFDDDRFYSSIEDLIEDMFDGEEDEVKALKEDWILKVETTELEPIFEIDADKFLELLANRNEDRLTTNDSEEENVLKAINESVDFEKLKNLLPKYYYPTGKYVTLTKKDLIDCI